MYTFFPPSLWRRAYARNVRLYYPYCQYTNLFIFRFVSLLCLRSTLRLCIYIYIKATSIWGVLRDSPDWLANVGLVWQNKSAFKRRIKSSTTHGDRGGGIYECANQLKWRLLAICRVASRVYIPGPYHNMPGKVCAEFDCFLECQYAPLSTSCGKDKTFLSSRELAGIDPKQNRSRFH